MTDKQAQQAKAYQDLYLFYKEQAKAALDRFIFGGIEDNLKQAQSYAKLAKGYREKWSILTKFEKVIL